jgi:hypothetical protein
MCNSTAVWPHKKKLERFTTSPLLCSAPSKARSGTFANNIYLHLYFSQKGGGHRILEFSPGGGRDLQNWFLSSNLSRIMIMHLSTSGRGFKSKITSGVLNFNLKQKAGAYSYADNRRNVNFSHWTLL